MWSVSNLAAPSEFLRRNLGALLALATVYWRPVRGISMPDFDTVLHPDFLVPMVPKREVITGHSVAVKAGQIAAILPRAEAQSRCRGGACRTAALRINARADQSALSCRHVFTQGLRRRSAPDDMAAAVHLADRASLHQSENLFATARNSPLPTC